MKRIVFFILLFSLCIACNRTETKIFRYIKTQNIDIGDTCVIDLREVLDVDYDCLYLFVELTPPEYVAHIIGIPYNNSRKSIYDSKHRMILVKDDKIVYEDDIEYKNICFETVTDEIFDTNMYCGCLVHHDHFYKVERKQSDYYVLEENTGKKYYWMILSDNPGYYKIDSVGNIVYDTLYHW